MYSNWLVYQIRTPFDVFVKNICGRLLRLSDCEELVGVTWSVFDSVKD